MDHMKELEQDLFQFNFMNIFGFDSKNMYSCVNFSGERGIF
jgi:hypothetical protein